MKGYNFMSPAFYEIQQQNIRELSASKLENLKRAFSAPRIWSVEEGHLAKFVRLPAWEIKRAPTTSPIKEAKLGAMSFIFVTR